MKPTFKHIKNTEYIFLLFFFLFLLCPRQGKAQFYSVQTNGLEWATGTINIEGSMLIKPRWTLHVQVACNPWTLKENKKIKHWLVEPGARYWLWQSYVGRFVGMYAIATRYNMGWKKNRFDGVGFGLGASYGYTWLIGKRWNLEAEGGLGAVVVNRKKYEGGCCGDYVSKGTYLRPAPKLALSVAYLF